MQIDVFPSSVWSVRSICVVGIIFWISAAIWGGMFVFSPQLQTVAYTAIDRTSFAINNDDQITQHQELSADTLQSEMEQPLSLSVNPDLRDMASPLETTSPIDAGSSRTVSKRSRPELPSVLRSKESMPAPQPVPDLAADTPPLDLMEPIAAVTPSIVNPGPMGILPSTPVQDTQEHGANNQIKPIFVSQTCLVRTDNNRVAELASYPVSYDDFRFFCGTLLQETQKKSCLPRTGSSNVAATVSADWAKKYCQWSGYNDYVKHNYEQYLNAETKRAMELMALRGSTQLSDNYMYCVKGHNWKKYAKVQYDRESYNSPTRLGLFLEDGPTGVHLRCACSRIKCRDPNNCICNR